MPHRHEQTTMSGAASVSVFGTGAFIAAVGVLIRYFGYTTLIAGYDPETVTDEDGLAEFVGARLLLIAALTVGVGVADYYWPSDGTPWYWYVYGALVAILAAWLILGARRYEE